MANFTSKVASFGSGDIGGQQADLIRQQQLAQALAQQANEPLQQAPTPAGGFAVPVSGWQTLSKVLQQGLSAYANKAVSDKEKEFNTEKAQKISDALGNWDKIRTGTPNQSVQVFGTDPDNPTTQTIPGQAPNPRGAAQALLTSGVPELQQLGMQAFLKDNSSKFSTTPQYDQNGNAYVLDEQGNTKYLGGIKGREKLLNVDGQLVGEYTGNKQGAPIPKRANPATDLLIQDADGNWVPNTQLADLKRSIAKSGAPNVNVKTDVKMGESLGAQVGPILKDASDQATAAANQVGVAQRIQSQLTNNQLFTGRGADVKLQVAQLGDALGVTGKDTNEKIANTRAVMQDLANLTLEGRKQMRGQGAITENESKLAERAISGDINLTPAELKVLAGAAERSGRTIYGNYQRKIDALKQNPNVNALAPYYEAQPLPDAQEAPVQNPQFKIIGVR